MLLNHFEELTLVFFVFYSSSIFLFVLIRSGFVNNLFKTSSKHASVRNKLPS